MTRLLDRLIRRDGYWDGLASGAAVLTTSYGSPDREAILPQLTAWAQSAYGGTSVVFSAMVVRMLVLSEVDLVLQAKDDKHLFTDSSLALLQEPWPDAGSAELLTRMELDSGLAGNAYIWGPPGAELLVRLRPDWTTIVSEVVPVDGGGWYRRKVGYWHEPPKGLAGAATAGFMVPADEVAHWAPLPDPAATFRGMSWLTPVARDIRGDDGLTSYKIKYLQNNASPNLLIKYAQKLQPGTVDAIRERMHARYGGMDNAFKTLILDQGADATVIGNTPAQMDFSAVQQAGSDRILAASSVPGVLVGLEPLRGAGKGYQESIDKLADMWARPMWRSACQALAKFVPDMPVGVRLWYDASDVAMLQDSDNAKAQSALIRMQALLAARQAGYDPMSAVAAIDTMDLTQLKPAADPPPLPAGNVQHLLGQTPPGATADPLPPTLPRLSVGSTSPGDGGNGTRPAPRPASARRAVNGARGDG